MKATEQYFSVVLLIILHQVAVKFKSVDEILKCDNLDESCRAALFFSVLMLYQVVVKFKFVDEILKCDHLNESY